MKDKISVEDKVLAILKSAEWVGSDEIELRFLKGEPGHFSWPQRLRGLRDRGYTINRRIRKNTKNLSEWHLGEADTSTIPLIKAEMPFLAPNSHKLSINTLNAPEVPENAKLPHCPIFERLGQKVWF